MRIKRYKIAVIEPSTRDELMAAGWATTWTYTANDMASAWAKFCTMRFGILKPNPADYDISLERATLEESRIRGDTTMKYSDCKTAFVEPGASNMIDLIHPETGKSLIQAETLEQIRVRYPTAEIVNVDDWCAAKAAKQDEPVIWKETTKERYWEMLEVLPPAYRCFGYFLVGEPWDHHAVNGRPRYAAFGQSGNRFVEASRPMTIAELKALVA